MAYKTSDGRSFTHATQARRYEDSLHDSNRPTAGRSKDDIANAPGGDEWEHNIKAHGIVTESTIKNVGNGRWQHTAVHADGTKSTSVHPQWFRAQEVQGKYFDPDGKPGALETHQRSRAQPVGEKESNRIAREDGREEEES